MFQVAPEGWLLYILLWILTTGHRNNTEIKVFARTLASFCLIRLLSGKADFIYLQLIAFSIYIEPVLLLIDKILKFFSIC